MDPEPAPSSALALLGRRSAEGAGSAGSPPGPWAGAGGALGTRCGLGPGWAGSRPQLRPLAPRAWTGFHEINDGERKESGQMPEGPGQDRLVARSVEGRDLGAICSRARGSGPAGPWCVQPGWPRPTPASSSRRSVAHLSMWLVRKEIPHLGYLGYTNQCTFYIL